MLIRGQTRAQWHAENHAWVEKQRRKDAPEIAKIMPQWRYENEWHPHFAWFPVEVEDGTTAWLQTVERRLRIKDNPPTIMATWFVRDHIYRLRAR